MNAPLIVEDVIRNLQKRFGKPTTFSHNHLLKFSSELACSINYSKHLHNQKFFFNLAKKIIDPKIKYPKTTHGDFVLLVCRSTNLVLMIPQAIILKMLTNVPTRK